MLFKDEAPWPIKNVQVFEFTTGYIDDAADDVLKSQIDFLARHDIKIALAIQSVAKTPECSGPGEGFDTPEEMQLIASKLKRLGTKLDYLVMDEPVWFGSFTKDHGGCRYSMKELANHVAINVGEYLTLFPKVILGDIEPLPALTKVPNWEDAYKEWRAALEVRLNRPVSSLRLDVNWVDPSWIVEMVHAFDFARSSRLQIGVIYNSGGPDNSDASWVRHAIANIVEVESRLHLNPDMAIFESWETHPAHAMPDWSRDSLSHLIRKYLLTKIDILIKTRDRTKIDGIVVESSDHNRVVSFVPVEARTYGVDSSSLVAFSELRGTVPALARQAIIGLRVNLECNSCSSPANFVIGDLRYEEVYGGTTREFVDLRKEASVPETLLRGGVEIHLLPGSPQSLVHITMRSGASYLFNSAPFTITPNAGYELKVPIATIGSLGLPGYITIIWLDGDGRGLSREFLFARAGYTVRASTETDANGHFEFSRNADGIIGLSPFQLFVPWSQVGRAAMLDVP